MVQWPDLRNGLGMGWAWPLVSMLRQRKVYSPAGSPGSSAAQWAFVSRMGQVCGRPA